MDNGVRCLSQGRDCDHINRGDDHSLINLQWLCPEHHKRKTADEAREAARLLGRKRPNGYQHPGLL